MKTTVDIADSLFAEARALAENQGVAFRQLVEDGLRLLIKQQRRHRPRFRLSDGSFQGNGLESEMSWDQVRQHIYEGRGE